MSIRTRHLATRPIVAASLFLLLLAVDGFVSQATADRCPGTEAEYRGIDADERRRICDAAAAAEAILANCGVKPVRPYVVRIVPEVRNPYGNCIFGRYRSDLDVAEIVSPAATANLVATIPAGEPMAVYNKLPHADLHRSLVVHEISHAIVQQNLKVPPCHAIHEYVAAVAQLGSLPEGSRSAYLNHFAGEDIYTTDMFNDIVLAMNPARFAAAAYRHFQRPENGCAFVQRLLTDPIAVPRVP